MWLADHSNTSRLSRLGTESRFGSAHRKDGDPAVAFVSRRGTARCGGQCGWSWEWRSADGGRRTDVRRFAGISAHTLTACRLVAPRARTFGWKPRGRFAVTSSSHQPRRNVGSGQSTTVGRSRTDTELPYCPVSIDQTVRLFKLGDIAFGDNVKSSMPSQPNGRATPAA